MNAPALITLSGATGIITYRRPDILVECLRRLLGQTRMPQEIIVADASPDADDIIERVRRELPELPNRTHFQHLKAPIGTTVQRNFILDRVQSDIILFLDDDTLVSPPYVEHIMAVYEADTADQVGGVEGSASQGPEESGAPPDSPGPANGRPSGWPGRAKQWVRNTIDRLGRAYTGDAFPDELLRPAHEVPDSLQHLPVEAVRTLYGCVMSFRTPLARAERFNEHLKRYAFLEDFDISYRIGKRHALLRCLDAPARHVGAAGGRMDPSVVAYMWLINTAFICRTSLEWTPGLQRHVERHARRQAQFERLVGLLRKTGFSQYRGVRAGARACLEILHAPEEQVGPVYDRAAERGIQQKVF
jgi:GT2 family glycosyltransferase